MESGKKAEAGPSTTTRGGFDGKLERKRETGENPPVVAAFIDDDDEDDGDVVDNGVPVAGFVPGPLLSLKEQIEKDKVLPFSLHPFQASIFSLDSQFLLCLIQA